jgi:hypothetical protein
VVDYYSVLLGVQEISMHLSLVLLQFSLAYEVRVSHCLALLLADSSTIIDAQCARWRTATVLLAAGWQRSLLSSNN